MVISQHGLADRVCQDLLYFVLHLMFIFQWLNVNFVNELFCGVGGH